MILNKTLGIELTNIKIDVECLATDVNGIECKIKIEKKIN